MVAWPQPIQQLAWIYKSFVKQLPAYCVNNTDIVGWGYRKSLKLLNKSMANHLVAHRIGCCSKFNVFH